VRFVTIGSFLLALTAFATRIRRRLSEPHDPADHSVCARRQQ
jgi:hypothetical protein